MGVYTDRLFLASLGRLDWDGEWIKPFFPPDHYIHATEPERFAKTAEVALSGTTSDDPLVLDGKKVGLFTLSLNTALQVGNDVVRLMARLHAQCEIHCWIEGRRDKEWVAGIIDRGLNVGLMRENQGWDSVLGLLLKPDDSPVVCSYSVCEQFPGYHLLPASHPIAKQDSDDRWEDYDALDSGEQWDLSMKALKSQKGKLRITRRGWDDFYFGDGSSAFTMLRLAGRA